MARPLRLEFCGALYHVTSRGNARATIYVDDEDRYRYLKLLEEVCHRFNWVVHAYCLMGNHYHLVIETAEPTLSRGMRQLNGVYTQGFNQRHRKVGHLFQGRYTAILVDKDNYLLELSRYVVLNPVRAGIVKAAGQWLWSNYRTVIAKVGAPSWLNVDWTLSQFGNRRAQARERYVAFVAGGRGQPAIWQHLRNQIYLGDESFIAKLQQHIELDRPLQEVPRAQRRPRPKTLDYYATETPDPREAMRLAYGSGGYTLAEIAEYFDVHYSTVSRAVGRR